MSRRASISALTAGAAAACAGVLLLVLRREGAAALGAECVALAFWLWARERDDRREQLARWGWLRRPAMALWLASGLALALPPARSLGGLATALEVPQLVAPAPALRDPLALLRALRALAVLWAGLELLAALPGARPYPDLTGPLPKIGPWLTALLPATGFLLLWRQSAVWTHAPLVREIAALALAVAAVLAVLRAYSRRTLTASLRWLVVADSALASMLVALDVMPGEVAALLWAAAAGGRLVALAAELRGQAARRGPALARAWRIAGWTAGASLAWPLLSTVGFADGRFHPFEFLAVAAPVFLASLLAVRRVRVAPERRAVARSDPLRAVSFAGAIVITLAGPAGLAIAWWRGFETSWPGWLVALLPPLAAWWPRRRGAAGPAGAPTPRAAGTSREFAIAAFRTVHTIERRIGAGLAVLARAIGAPARDLHTGDAQEHLLFLAGVAVLALLLPLFR